MSEFINVTVVREANVYFDGKVTSRTVVFEDGSKKTLGFMLAGEYSFDTGPAEIMEVLGGEMDIQLPGSTHWKTFKTGESFEVPANSSFKLVIKEYADYCCAYLED
ncbi:pyrimidine/purine nucleoside phosphorylase [Pontiellaceae bacterium B1224]|nr:pyrimidine/purine nucleoside phosphorylase [Pontiellaceae bacterium B1224]